MRISIPNFFRWYPFMSLLLALIFISLSTFLYHYNTANNQHPVTVTGLHHLGSDYRIDSFYIDKNYFSNVGETGEGGIICCLTLPSKWHPRLTADVRWVVHHVIRSEDGITRKKEETVAIYQAQVPIESYADTDRLWVHFFSEGRVRIVVSPIAPNGEQHPIRPTDEKSFQKATTGSIRQSVFTPAELADLDGKRNKYRNWK